jgi:uncharacterized protein with beta-barrel porin domain
MPIESYRFLIFKTRQKISLFSKRKNKKKGYIMRKLFVFLIIVAMLFAGNVLADEASEDINTPDNHAYGTNGTPRHLYPSGGAFFSIDTNYNVGDGDNLGTNADYASISNKVGTVAGTVNYAGNSGHQAGIGQGGVNKNILAVNVNGAAGTQVTIWGDSYVATTNIGAGTLQLGDERINIGKSLTGDVVFKDDGNLLLGAGGNIYGNITTDANNQGNLSLIWDGDSTITGSVGAVGLSLATIEKSGTGTGTFESDVFASTINTTGTANFDGNVNTTTLDLKTNSTAVIAANKNITGDVMAFHGKGTLTLAGGDQTVTGDIGTASQSWLGTINVEGAAGTATFESAILTKYFNITGDRTVEFKGDVETLNDFTFGSDNTVTLADGKNMTLGSGGITSPSGEGTLTLLGAHTITGNIGSTLLGNDGLELLTVGNGLATINGNIKAIETVFAADAGDNTLKIGNGYRIQGDVITTTDGHGILTFLGATSTGGKIGASEKSLRAVNFNGATDLYHNIFATTTNINDGSTVTASGNHTVTGNLNVKDGATLDFGSTTLTVSDGVFSSAAGSTISTKITGNTTGKIEAKDEKATVNEDTKIFIDVVGYITHHRKFTILESKDGGIGTILSGNITDDSRRFRFTQFADNNNLILLSHRYSTFEDDGRNPNAKAVGRALDLIDDGTATGDMLHVIDVLDALSDDEIGDALEAMEPEIDHGIIDIAKLSIGRLINTISSHLSMHRDTGIATGDYLKTTTKDIWAKVFGTYARQDKRQDIAGYRADVIGGAFGLDLVSADRTKVGISGGYSYGKIKSKQIGIGNTTADSIQGSLYYSYNDDVDYFDIKGMYFDLVGSFAYNMYEGKRNVAFGSINRTAKADYDGQQYSVYGEAGYNIPGNINITPLVSLQYMHTSVEGYTEKGADSLNLKVDKQQYNLLELGVGFKFSHIIKKENFNLIPSLRGKWLYDFIGDRAETTSRFTDYGPSFKTEGAKPEKSSFDIGTTVTFLGKNNIRVDFDYDFNVKKDYQSHSGAATFRYNF